MGGPRAPEDLFDRGIPVLGICYGMQTMAEQLGGRVASSEKREFGYAQVKVRAKGPPLRIRGGPARRRDHRFHDRPLGASAV
ncbi:glutamine amidotransferase-related protein [Marinobacter sp.]|uniref:glutamine amidotransferase-related protein n=1 Tax=Marinobacter sp. TaxID=50741 RepID=UPI003563BA31